ncbi:MAG: alpha/beta hydrolase [Pseudomonadaceae bacterium]|nr:alpha/beta hydrolase [Pseudomonadaceae bacterium]
MSIIVQALKYALVLLVIMAVAGFGYQWFAAKADRKNFPPPGTLYSVDGLNIHLDCRGQGVPTVLLEAGLTFGSTSWGIVHDALAQQTRVCAYDRPGLDWSERTREPLSAERVANRLHQLIELANLDGPFILLGMSAGGVFVREFYSRYPQQIVGMVLVDSSHEQQGNRLPSIGGTSELSSVLTLCSWVQPLGIVRALGVMDSLLERFQLPKKEQQLLTASVNQNHTCAAMLRESEGFNREVFDLEPPASLGDLPLIVVSQGKVPGEDNEFGVPVEQAREMAEIWNELQSELTQLSSRGQRHIATESGHVIQLEQPQIVIDAVNELVEKLRKGE